MCWWDRSTRACICIANVIQSHQMAWVFAKTQFFFFPHLLPCSPSFLLLLYSAPLVRFLSSAPSFKYPPLPFSPTDLIFLIYFICDFSSPFHSSPLFFFCTHFSGSLFLSLPLFPSLRHHVILSRTHYHQSMAELTQQLWLQSSILLCCSAHSHTQKHMLKPPLRLYLCGCLISQIECVSDIRLTCFLCSGLSLQRRGDQKSSFDWIDAAGSERRAWLSDSWADYNALKHVSNMPTTQWAVFQKNKDTVCPAPSLYLLPLSKHPRQISSSKSQSGELTVRVFSAPRLVIEKDH